MKKITKFVVLFTVSVLFFACGQKNEVNTSEPVRAAENPEIEKALIDSLNSAINKNLTEQVSGIKDSILFEAFSTVSETQKMIELIDKNKIKEAVDQGHKLIGKMEVILTKYPSTQFILADEDFKINELSTDIETVRETVKSAKKAMLDGYYQTADDILNSLKSEVIISDLYIPLITYPDAVKAATALLEEKKINEAKAILIGLPETVAETETVIPLPVLKAEQMIKFAAKIDAENHENSEKVLDLLKAADYQLQLAEELGYGNKDKDYKVLAESIKKLKKSVKDKSDSKSKFDSLKNSILNFKKRLFPHKGKDDIKK